MTPPAVTEKSSATSSSRLPSLTGMRFIAAAAVFFFHAIYENLFADPAAQEKFAGIFGQAGWVGVGFFFVLSGFVLTWSARKWDTRTAFWRRRFFKIYPNHVVTFVAAVLLMSWAGLVFDPGHAVANLLLLHAWFPQLEIEVSINPVAWSLSVEALFYLSFPWLLALIDRIPPRLLWRWTIGVVGAIFAIPFLATLLPDQPVPPWAEASEWQFWFIYVLPPVRALDFVLGMLLARIVMTERRIPLGLGGATALVMTTYFLASLAPWRFTLVAVMVVPLGLLIAAGARADVRGLRSPLASPVMVWLGEISFAFYLWHRLVLIYGHQLLGPGESWSTPVAIAVVALFLGVTVLLSWLLYILVERPIMRRWSVSRQRRKGALGPPTQRPGSTEPPSSRAEPVVAVVSDSGDEATVSSAKEDPPTAR